MQIEMLGERYQLEDPIGRGGMATIYRGRDLQMDRVVAIKVLREVYSTDVKFVLRFQLEAKAASALQHPNIVQVYDYGQTDGNYFIVMELVEGTDLRRYLRSRGILDVDRAVIIAHDVALGLGAAHRRNIVHRDVKPQNVLVGRGGSIKLTDFGIASVYKDINAERLTTTGMTLGTVQYYAPEQAQGEIVTPAADVYALGIVMYEMLTGRPPFDGDTPVAVAMQHIQDVPTPPSHYNASIPPALEEIILRCLEKVPEMRFRDGSQLARALETLGEADISEGMTNAPTVTPGQTSAPSYRQIPPRPNSSGGRTVPQRPTSSPNNMLDGAGATQLNGIDRANGSEVDRSLLSDQQTYMPLPGASPQATPQRPYQRRTQPREALQYGNRESSLATIITVLIILATIILLGFSIYLASSQFHLFNLPFGGGGVTPTATTSVTAPVPDLKGMSYKDAETAVTNVGFKLQSSNGNTSGVVLKQNPSAGNPYPVGQTIEVTMGIPTTTVPGNLEGNTLGGAEAILNAANIPFIVKDAGQNQNELSNTVKQAAPASGQTINVGQKVTLYVWNLNSTPTPTTTPPPSLSPSPSPTQKPSPSPSPSPTSTPTSTPTKLPVPSVTPSASVSTHQPGNTITPSITGPGIKTGSNSVILEVMGLWALLLIGLVRIRHRKRNGKDQP